MSRSVERAPSFVTPTDHPAGGDEQHDSDDDRPAT
jgi:hypothetical protein